MIEVRKLQTETLVSGVPVHCGSEIVAEFDSLKDARAFIAQLPKDRQQRVFIQLPKSLHEAGATELAFI